MKRPLTISLLTLLTACTFQAAPETRTASLSLNASVTEGKAPLEVTFSTTVSPAASRYTWTLAGQTLPETTPDLFHTFNTPGIYIVEVTSVTNLGSVSDSLTVSVKQAAPPEPPSVPVGDRALEVTQTPGGPAPWAVRYSVRAQGFGVDAEFRVRCSAEGDAGYEGEDGALCLHTTPGERAQVDVFVNGEVVDSVQVDSGVAPPQADVAFLGTWHYDSRGKRETFEITHGTAAVGESQAGDFKLFVVKVDGLNIAEFTLDGRTVVLRPRPEADGRQVFFAEVYGLRLERLD